MKRPLRREEAHLWAAVVSTVRPIPGRAAPKPPPPAQAPAPPPAKPPGRAGGLTSTTRQAPPPPRCEPEIIEPGRKRRIARGRDPIERRIDLHGLDRDRARAALLEFLERAQGEGLRAVLVITGKGFGGEGVLRRRAPEWLADPRLREVVAGVSPAERRHGGEGALYVALKRRQR